MRLTASLPEIVAESLADEALVDVMAAGSPVAISYPSVVSQRAIEFMNFAAEQNFTMRFFGAHKATNSSSLVKAARAGGFGCDVASISELDSALAAGYVPHEIIATGPKSGAFLARLAELPDVCIVLDSYEELERLLAIEPAAANSVLIRISRSITNLPSVTKLSRFGVDSVGYEKCVAKLQNQSRLTLRGVAFHLDSQSLEERIGAVKTGVEYVIDLAARGFEYADVLDIGGGLGSDYGVDEMQIEKFSTILKQAVLDGTEVTWRRQNYGLRRAGDTQVSGELSGIDMPGKTNGLARLEGLLMADYDGSTVAEFINENLIEIWCEPGAALYCAAGVVAASINEVRQLDGRWHVLMDIHRSQLCFENIEAPADPILITRKNHPSKEPYLLLGRLCAEGDILHQRYIHLPYHPQAGDILAWSHTGAYRAHFSAAQSIGHPLAKKYTYINGEFLDDL